jgi:hypothetical protein
VNYFGKYNGKYAGSWWGASVIIFIKGRATSALRLLNSAASVTREAYGTVTSTMSLMAESAAMSLVARSSLATNLITARTASMASTSGSARAFTAIAIDNQTSIAVSSKQIMGAESSVSAANGVESNGSVKFTAESTNG